jgi:hypothetical protein
MIRIRTPLSLGRIRSRLRHERVARAIRALWATVVVASSVSRRRGWSRSEFLCVLLLLGAPAVRGPAAAEDEEDDEAAEAGGEADDEGEVAVDPGFDFFADGAVGTLALCVISNCTGGRGLKCNLRFDKYRHQYKKYHPRNSVVGRSKHPFRILGLHS